MKEINDALLQKKINECHKKELEKFDLSLSGCSATIVI
jgi:hypothetical protein